VKSFFSLCLYQQQPIHSIWDYAQWLDSSSPVLFLFIGCFFWWAPPECIVFNVLSSRVKLGPSTFKRHHAYSTLQLSSTVQNILWDIAEPFFIFCTIQVRHDLWWAVSLCPDMLSITYSDCQFERFNISQHSSVVVIQWWWIVIIRKWPIKDPIFNCAWARYDQIFSRPGYVFR
jgi:hypothetical protein